MASVPHTRSIRVLFLAANPVSSALLKLNEEYEQIKEGIASAKFGEYFELDAVLSTDVNRLVRALLEHRPHIVHFSGHGSSTEEILLQATPEIENQLRDFNPSRSSENGVHLLGKDPLIQLLDAIKDHVRIVVLNACYSASQAEGIAKVIDWVVGMKSAVGDDGARVFSVAFYQSLAFGRTVQSAFDMAKAKLAALGLSDQDLPRLYKRPEVDASKPFLTDESDGGAWVGTENRGAVGKPSPGRHIVLRAGGSRQKIECYFREAVELGRSPSCDIAPEDAPDDVGNLHARVSYSKARDAYDIADLESDNGTFVNGQRIDPHRAVELRAGDEIRLGQSFRMLFRPQQVGGKESCAALVRLTEEGRESDCYVMAPRERVVLGNGEGCVARIPPPLLAEGERLGAVEWTPLGVRFREARDQGAGPGMLLEDGGEISLPQLTLRVKFPRRSEAGPPTPTVRYEPQGLVSDSRREKEVKKPDPLELPPWIRSLDIALGSLALIVLPLALYLFRPTPLTSVVDRWFATCRERVTTGSNEVWASKVKAPKRKWPPESQIQACVVDASQSSINDYQIKIDQLLNPDLVKDTYDDVTKNLVNQSLLLIRFKQSFGYSGLNVRYFRKYEEDIKPDFDFTREETALVRHGPRFAVAAIAVALLLSTRALSIQMYRRSRLAQYDAWQAKRTEETYELKNKLEEARKLARNGQDARALVLINQVLERRPFYDEAAELKRILQGGAGASRGTLIGGTPGRMAVDSIPADVPNLFLRILQTPYAYRAPRGFDRIALGRQRRREHVPGEPSEADAEAGNDLVIRVPGSDRLSLRISRRHIELQRIDKEYFVKDLSGGHTLLNGRALAKGVPYPTVSGDRLTIAGVIVLQVQIQAALEGQVTEKIIQVQKLKGSSFEATVGDMVTEMPDE
jgi:pSer/pThr/pTyr-binding forkhead associated (FHA) protein